MVPQRFEIIFLLKDKPDKTSVLDRVQRIGGEMPREHYDIYVITVIGAETKDHLLEILTPHCPTDPLIEIPEENRAFAWPPVGHRT